MKLTALQGIRLFVLDMAGTTVDDTFAVHDALIAAFAWKDKNITREQANLSIGVPKPLGIEAILNAYFGPPTLDEVQELHVKFLENIDAYYQNTPLYPTAGTLELFEYLRSKDIKIVLDTGFSSVTADLIIQRLGWNSLIDGRVCSDEVPGRPHPDMIFRAMEICGITEALQVVKVGDTPVDLQQGKNAGCSYVIAVDAGTFPKDALAQEKPDFIVRQLNEIIPIIEQHG